MRNKCPTNFRIRKTIKISFRVSEHEYKLLCNLCKKDGLKISDLIRSRLFLDKSRLEAQAHLQEFTRKSNIFFVLALTLLELSSSCLELITKKKVSRTEKKLFVTQLIELKHDCQKLLSEIRPKS